MKVWVNYVTFARDLDWLRYSLESFKKYCKGFSGVTIVVPTWDYQKFLQFERYSEPGCPVLVKDFLEMPGKGFVHHLAMKCCADLTSPQADFIIHLDPDSLAKEPITPEDYFIDGKPVIVGEEYGFLREYFPERADWKIGVDHALGIDAKHETMCRHPAIHHRDTYKKTRERVEEVHSTPFVDYMLKQKNSFPQSVGEFNTLGAVALKWFPEKYHLWDCTQERRKRLDEIKKNRELKIGHPNDKIWQGWSYRGVDFYKKEIREILK